MPEDIDLGRIIEDAEKAKSDILKALEKARAKGDQRQVDELRSQLSQTDELLQIEYAKTTGYHTRMVALYSRRLDSLTRVLSVLTAVLTILTAISLLKAFL